MTLRPVHFSLLLLCLASCQRDSSPAAPAPVTRNTPSEVSVPVSDYKDICVQAQKARTTVVMYHDVVETRERGTVWFDVTRQELIDQLDWLKDNGYTVISIDQLYDHLTKGTEVPPKSVVLTFDDNYQGFFDIGYPILKERNLPSTMFVHTGFVGDKSHGRPKMDYAELQSLVKEGLVTVGSHTVTHPDDITLLAPYDLDREMTESKADLEKNLGITVKYLAYPDGKNDGITQDAARRAGYAMAITTAPGPAEESPNIMAVNRGIDTKLQDLCATSEESMINAAVVDVPLADTPIEYELTKAEGEPIALIRGGTPKSVRSPMGREMVQDFVRENSASAGINGTFFAMAEIAGTSNEMVGPVQTSNEKIWVPDAVPERREKIKNRPIVFWGPTRFAIAPFQCEQMNSDAPLKAFMPDFTDAFVAGGWLIHDGKARTLEELEPFSAKDMMDPRRRVFMGIDDKNRIVFGASLGSVRSLKLAEMAASLGVKEAVMLDSGFSTSLVYGDKVLASGHSTPTTPSRPVPHAIVLTGTLAQDPNTIEVPQPPKETGRRRRRRK